MNEAEKRVLQNKQKKEYEKTFLQTYNQIKSNITYSQKIQNIQQDLPVDKLGDYKHFSRFDADNSSLILNTFRANPDLLKETITKPCFYYVLRLQFSIYTLAFTGTEEECTTKAIIQKALYNKSIPHIINGLICGEVNKKIITDIMINYDRQYGKILLDLYNKNLLFNKL